MMKNVTVTLDEETARWARVEAAERDTSVSSFLRELLQERMRGQSSYRDAMERYLARPAVKLGGGQQLTREDLHDRAALR